MKNERIIVRGRNKDPSSKKSTCRVEYSTSHWYDNVRNNSEFEDDGFHEDTEMVSMMMLLNVVVILFYFVDYLKINK